MVPERQSAAELQAAFLRAATWHGTLDAAEATLTAHPELRESGIHVAAVLGDDVRVRRLLAENPARATELADPYGASPLVYLGLSKYLRLDPSRGDAFSRAATALLDAGADANSGFMTTGEYPERETALYGAAGVAHHAGLTRLLLDRGADPNDGEAVYHSPESYDLGALTCLVETGRLTPESLALMLVRKHDWHDVRGAAYLLQHGADPNQLRKPWGVRPIHHAVARDNNAGMFEVLLDHGADPTLLQDGRSAVAMAAHRGRGDLLALFRQRGIRMDLEGADALLAACALGDASGVAGIRRDQPELARQRATDGGQVLAEFAGNGNTEGVRLLLELGVPADARVTQGDGYWDVAPDSTALHVAAWRAHPDTVKLLIERGAPVNAHDGKGRTPLMLAVKACVDSYWSERRTPDSVAALLKAGASTEGVRYPCGYDEVDTLLKASRAG